MSGEAGCFFRDQKRRIGEYNCVLISVSEELKLYVVTFKNVLDEVNKSQTSYLCYSAFFWLSTWIVNKKIRFLVCVFIQIVCLVSFLIRFCAGLRRNRR